MNYPHETTILIVVKRLCGIISATEEDCDTENSVVPTPKSTKLVGNTFFPPDFNVEAYRGETTEGEANSPRTPKTPGTAREGEKCHRRILEQRRQLVMQLFQEQGYFPSTQSTSAFQVHKQAKLIFCCSDVK